MGSTKITLGEIEMKEGRVKGVRMTDNKGEKRKGWVQMVLKEKARKQGWREGGEVFKSITEIE